MPIKVKCPQCYEKYQLADKLAGKKVRCKQCGEPIQIPNPRQRPAQSRPSRKRSAPAKRRPPKPKPVADDYGIDDFDDYGDDFAAPAPPRPSRSRGRRKKSSSSSGSFQQRAWMIFGGIFLLFFLISLFSPTFRVVFTILAVLSGLVFSLWGGLSILVEAFKEDIVCGLLYLFAPFYSWYFVFSRWQKTRKPLVMILVGLLAFLSVQISYSLGMTNYNRTSGNSLSSDVNAPDSDPGDATAPGGVRPGDPKRQGSQAARGTTDNSQLFPLARFQANYPRLTGNPKFRQRTMSQFKVYDLPLDRQAQQSGRPGEGMALRLYLPSGTHADGSLSCILVPPAGTNLLVGSEMDSSDSNPEHFPYVLEGYAVVTFSLDGWQGNQELATDSQISAGYKKFRAAHAGLVNAKIAHEFAANSVKEINPKSIYIAGHSSAATLALLYAAHEPKLAGCIAYAPETDVETSIGSVANQLSESQFPGIKAFLKQSSPVTHVDSFNCPVLLYHAIGDQVVPFRRTQAFAGRLKAAKKEVKMSSGGGSDHYQTMVSQGIPRGLSWLKQPNSPGTPTGNTPPTDAVARNEPPATEKSNPFKPVEKPIEDSNPFQKVETSNPRGSAEALGDRAKSARAETHRFAIRRVLKPVRDLKETVRSVVEQCPDYVPDSFAFDAEKKEFTFQLDGSVFAGHHKVISNLMREKRIMSSPTR